MVCFVCRLPRLPRVKDREMFAHPDCSVDLTINDTANGVGTTINVPKDASVYREKRFPCRLCAKAPTPAPTPPPAPAPLPPCPRPIRINMDTTECNPPPILIDVDGSGFQLTDVAGGVFLTCLPMGSRSRPVWKRYPRRKTRQFVLFHTTTPRVLESHSRSSCRLAA